MTKNLKYFYEFGPFRLDAGERLLLRDGEAVPLTPKTFDLLLVLVQHSGHLLEKEELMKAVWPDIFVEESNLADNIFKLRKALGEGGNGQRYIETVPKRGYRFVARVGEVEEESRDEATGVQTTQVSDQHDLTGAERMRLTKRFTENTEAYQAYVKGQFWLNKRTEAGFRTAIEYFEQAIDKDPQYALAYAGLAECYHLLAGFVNPSEVNPQAKEYAERALKIDETLPQAHTTLAGILAFYEWDRPGAEREFKRAIEPDRGYAMAHQRYSLFLMTGGRTEEGLAEVNRALKLDPISLPINTPLGWRLYFARI